jgi:hypothetical protein
MKTIAILTNVDKIYNFNKSFSKRADLIKFGEESNHFYKYNTDTKLYENQKEFSEGLYLVFDGIDDTSFSSFFTKKDIFILTHENSVCKPDKKSYNNFKDGTHERSCPFYPKVFEIIQNDDINDKIEEIINNVFEFDEKLENYLEKLQLTNLCEDKPEITKKVVELNQYIENK